MPLRNVEERNADRLPPGLDVALRAVTDILQDRLQHFDPQFATPAERAAIEDLGVSLDELRAMSEELELQIRHAEREHTRSGLFFEAAPYPFAVTDCAGAIEEANSAAVAFFGLLPHRLLGRPLATLVHDGQRNRFREFLSGVALQSNELWGQWSGQVTPNALPAVEAIFHARAAPSGPERCGIFWIIRPRDLAR